MGWEDAAASGSRSKARNLDLMDRLVKRDRFSVDFNVQSVRLKAVVGKEEFIILPLHATDRDRIRLKGNTMKLNSLIKQFAAVAMAPLLLSTTQAAFVITAVVDGDLSGGNPKAVILQSTTSVSDLSVWGLGSANNGGGSDGIEFTFPAGTASAGDTFVITGNTASQDFFANNFVQDFTLLNGGQSANINGDDAIELFNGENVVDIFGDINTDGTGEDWEYKDGFAQRTGGSAGDFDLNNYSINNGSFDGMTEQEHVAVFAGAGFTAVPEPSSVLLLGLAGLGLLRRRR